MHLRALVSPMRRTPVLAAAALVLMSAGVVANALFLQERQHPAPIVTTRTAPEEPKAKQRSDDLVLAVQAALRRVGYYNGPLDGLAGPQTRRAILDFQAASGEPETGEASLDLLAELKSAKREERTSLEELAAGGQELQAAPDPRIASVQHALAISAYGPIQEDGVLGPQTRDAILRFQQDHGLSPTGQISDALIVELRAAGALKDR